MRIVPILALAVSAPLFAASVAPAAPAPPSFGLPIQCRVGVDCEIQNYVDRDPGPGAKDYQCGSRSYQGHSGVDFRLPSMARQRQGVAVLAAADGKVLRARDGVADVSVRAQGPASVDGRECGNGVVIGHEGGFETQYCHMAQGSIRVKPGEAVKAGAPIGRVGLSGETEYPHLHLTVRQGQTLVDPFAYGAPEGACNAGRSLWRPELRQALAYKPRAVLNTGFAAQQLDMGVIEQDPAAPKADAPAILAYARAIGLKAGDVQTVTLRGPNGAELGTNTGRPLPRDQAQNLLFAGARRPAQGWARGRYVAEYVVKDQAGKTVLTRRFELNL
jgi:murein DD-endopeptidase MepM/ murein hydrolase activator NlpD